VTVLLIAALVPSNDKKKEEEKEEKELQTGAYQGKRRGKAAVTSGRVLTVPALLDPSKADQVWEIVESEAEDQHSGCPVTIDEASGTIAIAETNELEARLLLRGIRERMRHAGLIVHR
jgi:aconitase B